MLPPHASSPCPPLVRRLSAPQERHRLAPHQPLVLRSLPPHLLCAPPGRPQLLPLFYELPRGLVTQPLPLCDSPALPSPPLIFPRLPSPQVSAAARSFNQSYIFDSIAAVTMHDFSPDLAALHCCICMLPAGGASVVHKCSDWSTARASVCGQTFGILKIFRYCELQHNLLMLREAIALGVGELVIVAHASIAHASRCALQPPMHSPLGALAEHAPTARSALSLCYLHCVCAMRSLCVCATGDLHVDPHDYDLRLCPCRSEHLWAGERRVSGPRPFVPHALPDGVRRVRS